MSDHYKYHFAIKTNHYSFPKRRTGIILVLFNLFESLVRQSGRSDGNTTWRRDRRTGAYPHNHSLRQTQQGHLPLDLLCGLPAALSSANKDRPTTWRNGIVQYKGYTPRGEQQYTSCFGFKETQRELMLQKQFSLLRESAEISNFNC